MPDASDEQTWWSSLFAGGVDPGLEIPDGTWESVMTAALDVDTPEPADDLVPAGDDAVCVDVLDEGAIAHHDLRDLPAHDDRVLNGVDDLDPAVEHDPSGAHTHHDTSFLDGVYDTAPDDLAYDVEDANDDEI
jgi:hypothetical protein